MNIPMKQIIVKNSIKRIISLILLLVPFVCNAKTPTLKTCANVHGYWTQWQTRNIYYSLLGTSSDELRMMIRYNTSTGSFIGMEFRKSYSNEWDWCFKFEMDNYYRTTKKERKAHTKTNQWYEYSGWVEYYVTDDYPTIEKVLEVYKFPMIEPKGQTSRAKRRARATIKIAPYKNEPECFNIYFDGVGVGISFNKWPFNKSYVIQ